MPCEGFIKSERIWKGCEEGSLDYTDDMHIATTPEEQKQWMTQWRSAKVALYEQKFIELQAMTEEEALCISNMLLQFALGSYRNPGARRIQG